jgi:hypothetical protein
MLRSGLFLLMIFVTVLTVTGQKVRNNPPIPENQSCLKCHGQAVYGLFSVGAKKHLRVPMAASRVIPQMKFQNSIHGSLKCIDCHAEGYSVIPHPSSLKFDSLASCEDCHAGRKKFKKFHLDSIQAGFDKSVHAIAMGKEFTCWECHNPHSFITAQSDSVELKAAITLNNSACVDCHNNAVNYKRVSDKVQVSLLKSHDWLIHPELHLKNIRCIDCHIEQGTTNFTQHNILSAHKAVRDCYVCHSQSSALIASMNGSLKMKAGFLNFSNSRIMNYAFIMGANRSITLNIISTILFIGLLLVIFVHMFFLIRYRKLHKNG